jgi:hypothetical protein
MPCTALRLFQHSYLLLLLLAPFGCSAFEVFAGIPRYTEIETIEYFSYKLNSTDRWVLVSVIAFGKDRPSSYELQLYYSNVTQTPDETHHVWRTNQKVQQCPGLLLSRRKDYSSDTGNSTANTKVCSCATNAAALFFGIESQKKAKIGILVTTGTTGRPETCSEQLKLILHVHAGFVPWSVGDDVDDATAGVQPNLEVFQQYDDKDLYFQLDWVDATDLGKRQWRQLPNFQ